MRRMEYLDHAQNAKEPRVSERSIIWDLEDENKMIESQAVYSENLIEIDRKIAELTSGYLEAIGPNESVDPDIRRRIDEMKQIQRLEEIRKLETKEDVKRLEEQQEIRERIKGREAEEVGAISEDNEVKSLSGEVNDKI
mmetsp:Transcript_30141/g.31341  ORF Transcript_30141/g.31341 Transcript_30141/m.31341 type:complete len:139 (-) Transcript_30141:102-518(-)